MVASDEIEASWRTTLGPGRSAADNVPVRLFNHPTKPSPDRNWGFVLFVLFVLFVSKIDPDRRLVNGLALIENNTFFATVFIPFI